MCLSTITTNNNTPTLLFLCVLGSDHLPLFGEGCVIYIYFLPQHVLEEEKHLLAWKMQKINNLPQNCLTTKCLGSHSVSLSCCIPDVFWGFILINWHTCSMFPMCCFFPYFICQTFIVLHHNRQYTIDTFSRDVG